MQVSDGGARVIEVGLDDNSIVVAQYEGEILSLSVNGTELDKSEYSIDGDVVTFRDECILRLEKLRDAEQ